MTSRFVEIILMTYVIYIFNFRINFLVEREILVDEEDEDNPWFVLVDSDYQGLQRLVDTILPHKKQPNRAFTRQQQNHNQALASERVICERFYGRLKTKFRIMSSKYRNSREEYRLIFMLCTALTNYNIILHPL